MTETKTTAWQRRNNLMGGMAAATLGILVFAPASGWLVRAQLLMAGGGPTFGRANDYLYPDQNNDARRAEQAVRVAAQNPDDLGIQMAARQQEMPTPSTNAYESMGLRNAVALRPLLAQFGDRPALHAAVLRGLSHEAVSVSDRLEQNLLTETKPHVVVAKPDKNANLPENLASWEQSTRAGERLDPDNAFFPLMQAVGLFAAHRDTEAIAALRRAGSKTRYDEYLGEETQGQWRLIEQAQGEPGHIARLGVRAAQLNPDYAEIGQAVRLAAVLAMQDEMAGDTESGYQTRRAITRIGGLMRTNSEVLYGGLAGRRVGMNAWLRPGGVSPLPKMKNADSTDDAKRAEAHAARAKENLDRYCVYLRRIGHTNAVSQVRWEYQAGETFRKQYETAEGRTENVLGARPAFRLIGWWTTGVGLLTNLFLLLVLGGTCTFLARTAPIRAGLPLSPAARAGMVSAFFLPAYGFGLALLWPKPASLFLLGGGVAALILVLWKAARHGKNEAASSIVQTTGGSGKRWAAASKSANVNSFLNALWATVLVVGALFMLAVDGAVRTFQSANAYMSFSSSIGTWNTSMLVGMGLSSGVSLLLLLVFVVHSRMTRVPASVGVVRGFRKAALPIAAALVFVYAGVVWQTLREEAHTNDALQTCVEQGESRYMSGLTGTTLPGMYEETKGSQR